MKKTATLLFRTRNLGTSVRCILALLLLNFIVPSAKAQITIDGNPAEWPAVFTNPAITVKQFLVDPQNSSLDDIWTQGSADVNSIATGWNWTQNSSNDKNDMKNVGVALIGDVLYFFADRFANNGDAQLGIWLLRGGVSKNPDGTFSGVHQPGDILLRSHFVNGGGVSERNVYVWQGTDAAGSPILTALPITALNFVANAGQVPVPNPWVYSPKSGTPQTYPANSFVEGFLDLGELGVLDLCFASFLIETGNSQSINSSLEDLVLGQFGSIPDPFPLSSTPYCTGQGLGTITMTGSAVGVSYQLITDPGGSNVQAAKAGTGGNLVWTGVSAGSYKVRATNTTTNCVNTFGPVTVVANAPPSCAISGTQTLCAPATGTFTASGGGSYSWSGPNGFTAGNVAMISNLTASGTYTVTVTSAENCTSTCSRQLTINQPPSCSIGGTQTVCAPTTGTFTASGGGTYSWSGPGGFSATGAVISNLTASGTYTVTITSAENCTRTCSREFTRNQPPSCSITPGNQTICQGSTASFTASGGGTYSWSGPNSFSSNSAIISGLTATGTYTVTITSAQNCTSTCSRDLTVVSNPVCNILPNNQTICAGTTGSFTATGGSSYSWAGPNNFSANTAVISNLTAAGTYRVTVTAGANCTSTCSRDLAFVPNASANAGAPPAAQCRNATVVAGALSFLTNTFALSGSVQNGTPSWAIAPGGNPNGFTVVIVSPNSVSTNVQISGADKNGGTVTFRLTATSNTTPPCNNATSDVTVTLNPRPLIRTLIGSDFCPNVTTTGSVSLQNSENGVSYQLKDDGNNNVQAPKMGNGGTLVWTGLPDGSYTVVGTFLATTCNSTSGPADVVENPVPDVSITPVNDLCTTDNCVTLAALPAGGTFSGTGVSNGQFCPNGLAPGAYTVRYTYTNTQGCTSSASIIIDVLSCGEPLCTYTQGYFGNAGGLSCDGTNGGLTTTELINQSISNWGGTINIGFGNNRMTIPTGAASCVIDKLPGGGPSTELAFVAPTSICNLPASMLQNGRIKNTLLAQTIALGLNIGIDGADKLSDFALQAGTLYTAGVNGGCGSDVPLVRECLYDGVTGLLIGVNNEYEARSFSQALMNAIDAAGYPQTVGGLFSLASDALGNKDGVAGSERGVSLTEIGGAAGAINEIFDECRIPQGWDIGPCPPSNIVAPPRILVGTNGEVSSEVEKLKVSAYPNPYRDNVRFVIESPVSGQAVLEVYNIAGQKIQTVFAGHMQANETRIVEYKPGLTNAVMIYTLRIGNRQVTGKLVGLRK